ncbi:MAG: alpha/beta hydrolase [Candidatus Eremiobacteraeota bacterium]|nr:alpha/beta hydrolase [Candidatus Eremiobacteraeota bacterium]MBV8365389.1 alpha/beta hydrolase [Candidatus Eremiobacteraeota bacterium]
MRFFKNTIAAGAMVAALLISPPAAPGALAWSSAPTKTVSIGNMHFDVYGTANAPTPALILLPGLSMGSWEWQTTIGAFANDHTVYAATMSGFDGTPASPPPYVSQADTAILRLVSQENLKQPVIIGHGFGGHIALRVMEEHPDTFAGAVIVDETPYFPPLAAGQTAQQRAQNIASFSDAIASAPDWIYQDQTRSTSATMVSDPARASEVADHSLRSDRTTLAGAMSEMSLEDLRPGLARIDKPMLVIAPVSAQAPYMNDQLRALAPAQLDQTIHDYYLSQYAGARSVTVQTIDNSKDFVMLDQPDALNAAIGTFLRSVRP